MKKSRFVAGLMRGSGIVQQLRCMLASSEAVFLLSIYHWCPKPDCSSSQAQDSTYLRSPVNGMQPRTNNSLLPDSSHVYPGSLFIKRPGTDRSRMSNVDLVDPTLLIAFLNWLIMDENSWTKALYHNTLTISPLSSGCAHIEFSLFKPGKHAFCALNFY